jgi:hypothetical protein
MKLTPRMHSEILLALSSARIAQRESDFEVAWQHLIRAYIISQPNLRLHILFHSKMLRLASITSEFQEIIGQILRLMLAPLGHFLGITPWGNIGRATVSIISPNVLPSDISQMYAEAGIRIS